VWVAMKPRFMLCDTNARPIGNRIASVPVATSAAPSQAKGTRGMRRCAKKTGNLIPKAMTYAESSATDACANPPALAAKFHDKKKSAKNTFVP